MTQLLNQQVVLAARPDGDLKPADLRLEDVAVPTPRDGEVQIGRASCRERVF